MAFKLFVGVAVAALLAALLCTWDTFDPDSIRGIRVLVTGASSGIGEELAYQYSKLGASVVITARRGELLQKVAAKCKELGAEKVGYVVADMTKPEDRLRVVADTEKHLGGLDHLILNHALLTIISPWLETVENLTLLNAQLQVNFVSYVDIASRCMKMLSASNGNIGIVSSGVGKIPVPGYVSYSANIFALEGFFGGYRHELRVRRVDVSVTLCVLGVIDTESFNDVKKSFPGTMPLVPAAVDDTALAIIKGVAERSREIYTPFSIAIAVYLHKFFPDFTESVFAAAVFG